MHWQDRLGARRDCGLDPGWVDSERARLDIDEDAARAGIADRRHGGDKRKWCSNHLVAGTDASDEQRQVQRAGAAIEAKRLASLAVGSKFLFECSYLFA